MNITLHEPRTLSALVHYHIMKNAGTTIAGILRREFPGAFAEVHGPHPGAMLAPTELLSFLDASPHITAVSSHHLRFPVPAGERIHIAYCCFLRHPIDRLYSLYSFLKNSDFTDPVSLLAQTLPVREFFTELIGRHPNYVQNAQTIYLGCRGFFLHPPTDDDLRRAVDVMKNCTVPGVVHRTEESLVTAEYFLQGPYPGIQLHGAPQNVTANHTRPLQEREKELKEILGSALYRQLSLANAMDLKLLRETEREIDRRKLLVPSFDHRRNDYRSRCARETLSVQDDAKNMLAMLPTDLSE